MEIRPILSALLRSKTGPILVALQVALSLAILANALYIVNDRSKVVSRPSGLLDEHSTFHIDSRGLNNDSPEQVLATMNREIAILRAVPGVVAAANVNQMPMSQSSSNSSVGLSPDQERKSAMTTMYQSSDSLIKTFGLNLVEGRDFQPQEFMDINERAERVMPPTVIVTRALAEKLWPGVSAIGKSYYIGKGSGAMRFQVIGVVEHLQTPNAQTDEKAEWSSLFPARFYGSPGARYVIRTEPGQRDRVMKEAESALRKASATPLILQLHTVDDDRKDRYRGDVALQWMLVTVSLLLLLVTSSGIVGMASLWVTQRRKQIGVRRALGARKVDILRYFILENFMITSGGVFGGVALGLALNQLLVSKLEMARLPAGYLVGGAVLFWLLGVIAAYGPAWRAASISPATATRSV